MSKYSDAVFLVILECIPGIYRVHFDNSIMILTFLNEKLASEFMNKYVSRYTCDVSSVSKVGLSVVITDKNIINKIIEKSKGEYIKKSSQGSHVSEQGEDRE